MDNAAAVMKYSCAECGAPAYVLASQPAGIVTIERTCAHDGVVFAHASAVMVGKSGMAKDAGIR